MRSGEQSTEIWVDVLYALRWNGSLGNMRIRLIRMATERHTSGVGRKSGMAF